MTGSAGAGGRPPTALSPILHLPSLDPGGPQTPRPEAEGETQPDRLVPPNWAGPRPAWEVGLLMVLGAVIPSKDQGGKTNSYQYLDKAKRTFFKLQLSGRASISLCRVGSEGPLSTAAV